MNNKTVLVTSRSFGKTSDKSTGLLINAGWKIDYMVEDFSLPKFEQALVNYDVLIIGGHKLSEDLLRKCPKLKLICKHGAGLDNIPLDVAKECSIMVTNTPGTNSDAVADFTILLMLSSARNLIYSVNQLRERNFVPRIGVDITKKKLGLLGFGNIARRVAKRAHGFDMDIQAYDPFVKEVPKELSFVKLVDFERVLKENDFICIHLPLTPQTKDIIGAKEFSMMKRSAQLIDTARGGIVDEMALYEALKNHVISKAALDVTESEPISENSPLLTLENIILTNHVASYSQEALDRISILCSENILAMENGKPLLNRVV